MWIFSFAAWSKGIAYPIISGLALTLLPLLVHLVNQADRANNICSVDFVRSGIVQLLSDLRLLHHACISRQLLNKLERVDHHSERLCALLCDGHEGDQARLQAILQHERRAISPLQVKRDRSQPAHVEECLVLDSGDAIVLQVLDVHKRPLLRIVLPPFGLEG